MNQQRRAVLGGMAALVAVFGLALISAAGAAAQGRPGDGIQGIEWTVLQKATLAGAPGKDEMMGVAEIAPGVAVERHSHAEVELGYVLQGELVLEADGEAPRTIKAGDSFAIPAGTVHRAKNGSPSPAKVLAIYIVERGKPLAEPAH
ncbi:cupin domain-containing protein [Enterovirga sp. CN4-39]|uniref:cupin domain-containing protein n=1 Tax=Enterovirga sp. CN4-39 TaxID=3400910 RepID=UPI003C07BEE4